MKFMAWVWRILKATRILFLLAFLVASLTLNVLLFVGGEFYALANAAFEAGTGLRSVASQHADEVAEISGELAKRVKPTPNCVQKQEN